MSKEDWLEYFEAVNGRSATEEEIAQALAAGEFVEAEQVSAEQAPSDASSASSSFEQPQQEAQTVETTRSTTKTLLKPQKLPTNLLLNSTRKFHSNKRIKINLLIRDNHISNKDFSKRALLLDSLSLLDRKLIRTTRSKDSSIHKYLNKDRRLITVSSLLSPTSFLKQ